MGIVEYEMNMQEVKPIESLAQKIYNKQVKDITNISHTEGYKEIKRYWKTVGEGAKEELKTVSPEILKITQMKCMLAESFVTFLENLEKSKEVSKQAKV